MDPRLLQTFVQLFADLPQVIFCVKDRTGRYVAVNQAFAERVGRRSATEVVGLRARDVFPPSLARSYESQDEEVIASGRPLQGHLELVLRRDGAPGWFLTNKVLLGFVGADEAVIVSLSVDLEAANPGGEVAKSLKPVVEMVQRRFAEPLGVDALAGAADLSRSQLERRMQKVFGISAKQYLLRTRLQEAVGLIVNTDLSIGTIATRCGYYDQSALIRHVRRIMGVTPGQLRSEYETAWGAGHRSLR